MILDYWLIPIADDKSFWIDQFIRYYVSFICENYSLTDAYSTILYNGKLNIWIEEFLAREMDKEYLNKIAKS